MLRFMLRGVSGMPRQDSPPLEHSSAVPCNPYSFNAAIITGPGRTCQSGYHGTCDRRPLPSAQGCPGSLLTAALARQPRLEDGLAGFSPAGTGGRPGS